MAAAPWEEQLGCVGKDARDPLLLCLLQWQVDSLQLVPPGKPNRHFIPSHLTDW